MVMKSHKTLLTTLFPFRHKINACTNGEKQPLEVFSKKMFLNILQISQKFPTPALESLLNKVARTQACNFIEKRLQHRCFPMKFAKFFRTSILKNFSERLLLDGLSFNVFDTKFYFQLYVCYSRVLSLHLCSDGSYKKIGA